MAQKRMFSLQIVDSDAFLDMPTSSQLLYFHLSMRADDDGFVDNPKKIMRMTGALDDDIKVLLGKRFILSFESGVIVIKHWKIHNYIAKDRYNETKYIDEKAKLLLKDNGSYTECIQNVDTGKVRLGKVRLDKYIYTHLKITKDEYQLLKDKFNLKDVHSECVKADDWLAASGKRYKDYPAFMRNWLRKTPNSIVPSKDWKTSEYAKILAKSKGM